MSYLRFFIIFTMFTSLISCQSKNPFYGIDSEDKTGPNIYIDYPSPGSTITSTFTLIGRAEDKGGNNTVLRIEISFDNGSTWRLAGGTTNWSYTVDPFSIWGILSNQTRYIIIKATDTDYKKNTKTVTISYIINNTNPDLLGSIKDSNDTITYDGSAGYDGYHNATEGNIVKYEWDDISGAQGYEMTLYNTTDLTSAIVSIDTPPIGSPVDCSAGLAPTGVTNAFFSFNGTKLTLQFQGVNGKKYYLAVKPYNSSLQRGPVQISISETIDTVAPSSVTNLKVNGKLDTDPDKYFSTKNITFSWNAATDLHTGIRYYKIDVDNNGTFDITVDGSITNYTYSYPADGSYTASVASVDMAGNYSGLVTITFTIDTVNPGGVVISDNGLAYSGRRVIRNNHHPDGVRVVKFTWNDIADARYYLIRVNEVVTAKYDDYTVDKTLGSGALANGANTGITSVNWSLGGGVLTFYFTGLDNRRYYITVKSKDNAGNIGPESSSNLVWVDNILPTAGSVSDPGNYTTSATINFSWSGFSDTETGIEKYIVASSDDGANWSANQDLGLVTSVSTNGYAPETFNDGENVRLRVKAVDYVGNESAWASSNGIIIDQTNPTFTLISTPAANIYSNTTPLQFTGFNGADANFRYYEYMIITDGVPGALQTSPAGQTNPTISIAAPVYMSTYRITARAVDYAGNVSGWVTSNSITYDNQIPTIPTGLQVEGSTSTQYYNVTKNVNISWNASTDFSGIQYYQIDINNDGTPDGSNEAGTLATRNLNAEGLYTIRVRAVDNANNIGNWTAGIQVYIDLTPPNNIAAVNGIYNAPNAEFSWVSPGDALSGIKQYWVQISTYNGSSWSAWSASTNQVITTYSYDMSALPSGNGVKIRVQAEDNAGNLSVWTESNEVYKP